MNLFDVVYVCRDTQLIRIIDETHIVYQGDVFTYRSTGIKYSVLGRPVCGLDIIPSISAPILVIKIKH